MIAPLWVNQLTVSLTLNLGHPGTHHLTQSAFDDVRTPTQQSFLRQQWQQLLPQTFVQAYGASTHRFDLGFLQ